MKLIPALVVLLGIVGSASAYDIDDLVRDLRASQAKAMQDAGDLKMDVETTFLAPNAGGSGGTMVMYRKGSKWRIDSKMTMGGTGTNSAKIESTTLFDGNDLWTVAMGMKTKLPAEHVSQSSTLTYWNEPVTGSRIIGTENIGGRDCWIVEGPEVVANPLAASGRSKAWIDKTSFIQVQSEVQVSGKTMRTTSADFRKIEGGEIPHLTEVFSDNQKTMTAKITKIEVDAGLSDELFEIDKFAGSSTTMDMDALMKQAEAMKKQMEAQAGQEKK